MLVPRTTLKVTSGTPKHWTFTQSDSGLQFQTSFCGDCGTMLFKQNDEADDLKPLYIVMGGTLDGGLSVGGKPQSELWVGHRGDWLKPLEGVQQCKGFT